jgi:hypothetical protein
MYDSTGGQMGGNADASLVDAMSPCGKKRAWKIVQAIPLKQRWVA